MVTEILKELAKTFDIRLAEAIVESDLTNDDLEDKTSDVFDDEIDVNDDDKKKKGKKKMIR